MRKLLFPITLVGASIFLVFWYGQPTWGEIQEIQSQTAEYERALSEASSLQDQLNQKLEDRDQITETQRRRLNTILPETLDAVRFLIELDKIAKRSGMSVEDVSFSNSPQSFGGSPQDRTQSETPGQVPIYNTTQASFSVQGSYEDIQSFLGDLESSARIMDVTNFTISTQGDSSETGEGSIISPGVNSYDITLNTYWRKNSY